MHILYQGLQNIYNHTYTNPIVARFRLLTSSLHRNYQRERELGIEGLKKSDLKAREVLKGPFKGLCYPRDIHIGAPYYPKLLGTYEQELHWAFENLLARRRYNVIVDVGVAEGYYAVGLAMRCPNARVSTYDINPRAKNYLLELAQANGVAHRIEFDLECTPPTLERLAKQYHRGFLFSDCEGYELQLLQPKTVSALENWDLIIETHDSMQSKITHPLKRRLRRTHQVNIVRWHRRRLTDFPGSSDHSILARLAAMDEERTWRNKWLVCVSKSD